MIRLILTALQHFEHIEHMIRLRRRKEMTSYLCKLCGVSKSRYYRWLQDIMDRLLDITAINARKS
jgi:hypothetical protein